MNPIEELTMKYILSVEGDYEQVEPQVYDVVLSDSIAKRLDMPISNEMYRVTFDPEALTDHPDAQLLIFGHPTLDHIFSMAHEQGAVGRIFLSGFNLEPYQLLLKLRQQLAIDKELKVEFGIPRVLHFTLWFYWFQATFICDEKIQHLFEVGVDQYYGRLTRHFQEILKSAEITTTPIVPYPDVVGITPIKAYSLARSETIIRLKSVIRNYKAKLEAHLNRESDQITKYFDNMAAEIDGQKKKMLDLDKDDGVIQQKKRSLELEKQARLIELKRKMTLKVDLKLMNFLSVTLPKILTPLKLTSKRHLSTDLFVVWNPLTETVEPISCPYCGNPTLELIQSSQSVIHCGLCKNNEEKSKSKRN